MRVFGIWCAFRNARDDVLLANENILWDEVHYFLHVSMSADVEQHVATTDGIQPLMLWKISYVVVNLLLPLLVVCQCL